MSNIDISFNLFGHQKDVISWALQPTKVFNRFCYVRQGSTVYSDKDEVVKLEEGNVYLLPIKDYVIEERRRGDFDHVWAHFIIRGIQFDNVIKISLENDHILKSNIEIIDHIIRTYSSEQTRNKDSYILNCKNKYFSVAAGSLSSFLIYFFHKYYAKDISDGDFMDVLDYINIHINEPLSNKDLAKVSMYNSNYYIDKFKKTFGMTPQKYVLKSKISEAIFLLANNHKVEEISYALGYENPKSFSRAFKREVGISPNIYKSNYIDGLTPKINLLSYMNDNA